MGADPRRFLRRSASRSRLRAATAVLAYALATAAPVAAQVTPPPDTVPARPDTALVPDSLRADTIAAADTAFVPLVRFRPPADTGWVAGVWSWDLEALLREGALDLGELLERVPGLTVVRSGIYTAAAAPIAFGSAGDRVEIVLDGFAIDPLYATVDDLARIELANLRSVRVERRLDLLRIHLETLEPFEGRPYSRVDAGTGDFNLEVFRGVFLTPSFLGGPLGLAVDRVEGVQREPAQSANTFNGWVKWGLVSSSGSRGFQVEFRRASIDRDLDHPVPLDARRDDLVLRGRMLAAPGVVAEAFAGRSWSDEERRPRRGETADTVRTEREATQAGLRAALDRGALDAQASLRYRDGPSLPTLDAQLQARVRALSRLELGARAAWESWDGEAATRIALRAESRVLPWLNVFGEVTSGDRGVRFLPDSLETGRTTRRGGLRGGAELRRRGFVLAGAGFTVDADSAASFGLDFDEPAALLPGGDARGFEVHASIPVFRTGFRLEGWLVDWTGDGWIYLPSRSWRGGLVYHGTPLRDNDNLEVLARLEAVERGAMLVPVGTTFGPELVPARQRLDFYVQFRIVDVRVFVRWSNLTHQLDQYDVPGRLLPGQRANFGVFWEFWN